MRKLNKKINVWQGDITTCKVDAIVNAANKTLLGGGGVDGAIHRASGKQLKEECKTLGGAETGEAKITKGYNLPAKHVIHAVGPVYNDGKHGEPEKLRACYENAMDLAAENNLKTIAFPAISTGIYHYPLEEATDIAVKAVKEKLEEHTEIEEVTFVAFDKQTYEVYESKVR